MKKITVIWNEMRIKTKMILTYLTLLILSFVLTFSVLLAINSSYTKKEVGNAGTQTVSALGGNLSLIFDNVTQFSNLVYFDNQVQRSLRNVDTTSIDPGIYKTITKSLVNMILSGDYISGVYIRDSYGNFYSSYKKSPRKIHLENIPDTGWYQELSDHNGNGYFIHGSEEIIEYYGDTDYITYIREIRDENTYEPLAVLMVTVNEETIQSYFNKISDKYNSNFFIVNGKNEYIIGPNQQQEDFGRLLNEQENNAAESFQVQNMDGQKVLAISEEMGIEDWKLVGIFHMDDAKALAPYYSTIVIFVIFINIFLAFFCSMILTKMIFVPLSKVEKHMLFVEQGQFIEMGVDQKQNEITNLKRVYNHMIQSIQSLIDQVKEEEKVIARGELELIQAQINPHFLYNTLDAVSALALMKDFENCFSMTQALGNFYRNSLNSGKNFITIRDELLCIKSYLTILNIRYSNQIHAEYDVEEELYDCEIMKLLLQPLVENAVHHGIKGNCESGTIWIRIFSNEDEIILMVSDDGIGMSQDRIVSVLEGKTVTGKSGFGIHSLIMRITLCYGIENPMMIHSEMGNGTEVAVRIKRKAREGA